jgi:acyl carrier protein
MPAVTITLSDTPAGGVAIHTDFKPAIGSKCSAAQSAALDIISRTRKEWDGRSGHAAGVNVPSSQRPTPVTLVKGRGDVAAQVRTLIAKNIGRALTPADDDRHLVNDLEADSLDLIEIVMYLEDDFKVSLSDEEAEECHTVANFSALVQAKLSGAVPAVRA